MIAHEYVKVDFATFCNMPVDKHAKSLKDMSEEKRPMSFNLNLLFGQLRTSPPGLHTEYLNEPIPIYRRVWATIRFQFTQVCRVYCTHSIKTDEICEILFLFSLRV